MKENKRFKVYHSSAFQIISRRSVYIKIINYRDRISANLNNTIQTKQHAMKKPTLLFKQKQELQGTIFCGGRILSRKCSKPSIFVNSLRNVFNISLFLGVLLFQGYLKQGSNILKQFLYFFTKNFWEKIDINFFN